MSTRHPHKTLASLLVFGTLFAAACTGPPPRELLRQFERDGNLAGIAQQCGVPDLPDLPGVKSGWVAQRAGITEFQFSNLGLDCHETMAVPVEMEPGGGFGRCELPSSGWRSVLKVVLPPLDSLTPGEYPQTLEDPNLAPHCGLENSVTESGSSFCSFNRAGVSLVDSPSQVKVVIDRVSATCISGRIEGLAPMYTLGAHSLFPNGYFVVSRCQAPSGVKKQELDWSSGMDTASP